MSGCASESVLLNSGHQIPLVGCMYLGRITREENNSYNILSVGTYRIADAATLQNSLDFALESGYRLIDAATVYNESQIGDALKILLPKYNLVRKDIFIICNFMPQAKDEDYVVQTVQASLKKLQVDYIDLYLIQYPGVRHVPRLPINSPVNFKYRDIAWKGLVSAQKMGLVRSIGVSNYSESHLSEVLEKSHGIPPAVNQVHWNPRHHMPELLNFCQEHNIFLQAYSSLGGGMGSLTLDPVVQGVAQKLGRTGSQVLLRWATQKNIGVIPKACSQQHVKENITLDFTIPEDDMRVLSNMAIRENPVNINKFHISSFMMIANKVTELCVDFFDRLPKSGKPVSDREWTVLSAIVQEMDGEFQVVSMGTGTKCIGVDQMSESGEIVNDSHAEVVTRRAFLRYLMEQMVLAREMKKSSFAVDSESGKFTLKKGCKFHFFTTHAPCGDASIFPRKPEDVEDCEPLLKRSKQCPDNFTGAKVIDLVDDPMDQMVGCVRTKPGRGMATLSASCSDKMARWCVLGLQGGLLMNVLTSPIYLTTVIYPRDAIVDKEATKRAIWGRFIKHQDISSVTFHLHRPAVLVASKELAFPFTRHPQHNKCQPCPASVVWCRVQERPHEVAVAGRRQGVTKKKLKTLAARLLIAKSALFQCYTANFPRAPAEDLSYQEAKDRDYRMAGQWLKEHYFKMWPSKGENYLKFTCTN